ncbi:hypothetical protein [Streptomyces sp. NPDC051561]|uniref:hypothetical protein n=1 Tax=Streptomyces sp. NPDC051561 TaxID=3365658 RepID=UPI0037A955BB
MGATRRIRRRRTLAVIGAVGAAVVGVVACEPSGGAGGLSSFAVALTTDRTGTRALERVGIDVNWMTCTSTVGDGPRINTRPHTRPSVATSAPSVRNIATVSCEGQTNEGREIRIEGKVTDERDGRCVRGDLTAKVAGRTVFRANVLGDCNSRTAAPTSRPTSQPTSQPTGRPTVRPVPAPHPLHLGAPAPHPRPRTPAHRHRHGDRRPAPAAALAGPHRARTHV